MKTRFILITVWMGISFSLQAQEIVSLEQCYNLAEKNHPLQVKKGLLTQQTDFELGVLEKQKLPQLQLDAQVTYQSDVVSLPFDLPPNMDMSPPNQEQWKTTLTASQLVYNGGLVRLQQDIKKTELKVKKQEIAVSVNQIKTQINQVYFSVLLLNQTQEMLQNTIAQLQKKQVEVEKLIVNGVASASAGDPLQIKILELQQKRIALIANKNQLVEKLGVLIGKKISNNQFVLPEIFISATAKERPEYKLFTLQKNSIDQNDKLLQKKNYP
ncbi:MAG TPA: TolC family protein [Saprospiraceae bacterium]|nr:TolC family protein [Saprospiraceae bacterium]